MVLRGSRSPFLGMRQLLGYCVAGGFVLVVWMAGRWDAAAFIVIGLFVLAALGWGLWQRRLVFDPETRSLVDSNGWPFAAAFIERHDLRQFTRVLVEAGDFQGAPAYGVRLDGAESYTLEEKTAEDSALRHGAALALLFGLPLERASPGVKPVRLSIERTRAIVAQALASQRLSGQRIASTATLVAASLVPVGGVLFAKWSLASVAALIWIEMSAFACFFLLRALSARYDAAESMPAWARVATALVNSLALLVFLGGFLVLCGNGLLEMLGVPRVASGSFDPGPILRFVAARVVQDGLWVGLGAIVLSQAVSFVIDWLREGESKQASRRRVSLFAMARIMGGLLGLWVADAVVGVLGRDTGAMAYGLAIVLLVRLAADLYLHLMEHAPQLIDGTAALVRHASASSR